MAESVGQNGTSPGGQASPLRVATGGDASFGARRPSPPLACPPGDVITGLPSAVRSPKLFSHSMFRICLPILTHRFC